MLACRGAVHQLGDLSRDVERHDLRTVPAIQGGFDAKIYDGVAKGGYDTHSGQAGFLDILHAEMDDDSSSRCRPTWRVRFVTRQDTAMRGGLSSGADRRERLHGY